MSTTGGADSAAAETVSGAANKTPGWRDHLPIHPAADLFPLMSESELQELGEDIKKHGGLFSQIMFVKVGDGFQVLDGRNRLDAMELVGMGINWKARNAPITCLADGIDPYDYVLAANVRRRHLTGEQKRELIAKVLKAKPGESNRKIAKQVKVDDKTVAAVRRDLESTAEIPQLENTTGADGKQRKSRAKKVPEPKVAASPEVSPEQRKAEHARLTAEKRDIETGKTNLKNVFLMNCAASISAARYQGPMDNEIRAAAQRAARAWAAVATESDVTEDKGDIVEQCLSLIMAMNKEQRSQFFAKYTELMAERAPAREAQVVRRPPVHQN